MTVLDSSDETQFAPELISAREPPVLVAPPTWKSSKAASSCPACCVPLYTSNHCSRGRWLLTALVATRGQAVVRPRNSADPCRATHTRCHVTSYFCHILLLSHPTSVTSYFCHILLLSHPTSVTSYFCHILLLSHPTSVTSYFCHILLLSHPTSVTSYFCHILLLSHPTSVTSYSCTLVPLPLLSYILTNQYLLNYYFVFFVLLHSLLYL